MQPNHRNVPQSMRDICVPSVPCYGFINWDAHVACCNLWCNSHFNQFIILMCAIALTQNLVLDNNTFGARIHWWCLEGASRYTCTPWARRCTTYEKAPPTLSVAPAGGCHSPPSRPLLTAISQWSPLSTTNAVATPSPHSWQRQQRLQELPTYCRHQRHHVPPSHRGKCIIHARIMSVSIPLH